eukprot:g82167.t1
MISSSCLLYLEVKSRKCPNHKMEPGFRRILVAFFVVCFLVAQRYHNGPLVTFMKARIARRKEKLCQRRAKLREVLEAKFGVPANDTTYSAQVIASMQQAYAEAGLDWRPPRGHRPHILMIVADDLGYSDVGYHGSPIPTPTLDALSAEGVRLENYYLHPTCTPSRAALMTGRYAHKMGLSGPLIGSSDCGLPNDTSTIANELKIRGYSTHMVGKWHLGHAKWKYTPTERGFDTFYGIYNGGHSHYTKFVWDGYDLRRNRDPIVDDELLHSTKLFTREVIDILDRHTLQNAVAVREGHRADPLFIYLSYTAVHAPLLSEPEWLAKCAHIPSQTRRTYCGMVVGLDEGVRNVTQHLRRLGMWDDTVLVFTSDNGGMPHAGGLNYPFRGAKTSTWEGGSRVPAFVHGAKNYLKRTNMSYEGLMHIADWMPTLLYLVDREQPFLPDDPPPSSPVQYVPEIAHFLNGKPVNEYALDGRNMWEAISWHAPSPREDAVITIDLAANETAYRWHQWKIILGSSHDGLWYVEPDPWVVPNPNWLDKITELAELGVMNRLGEEKYYFYREILEGFRKKLSKALGMHRPPPEASSPNEAYLFDLSVDPYERRNLYHWQPEIAAMMHRKLRAIMQEVPKDFCDWRLTDPFHTHEEFQGKQFHAPWLDDDIDISTRKTVNVHDWGMKRVRIAIGIFLALGSLGVLVIKFLLISSLQLVKELINNPTAFFAVDEPPSAPGYADRVSSPAIVNSNSSSAAAASVDSLSSMPSASPLEPFHSAPASSSLPSSAPPPSSVPACSSLSSLTRSHSQESISSRRSSISSTSLPSSHSFSLPSRTFSRSLPCSPEKSLTNRNSGKDFRHGGLARRKLYEESDSDDGRATPSNGRRSNCSCSDRTSVHSTPSKAGRPAERDELLSGGSGGNGKGELDEDKDVGGGRDLPLAFEAALTLAQGSLTQQALARAPSRRDYARPRSRSVEDFGSNGMIEPVRTLLSRKPSRPVSRAGSRAARHRAPEPAESAARPDSPSPQNSTQAAAQ